MAEKLGDQPIFIFYFNLFYIFNMNIIYIIINIIYIIIIIINKKIIIINKYKLY